MYKSKLKVFPRVQQHQVYSDYENNHPFCFPFRFPNQSVSDTLEEYIDDWESAFPVFIDAPTGLGKTTFVYQQVLPRAKKKTKNVLLLSNRVSVSEQQKLKVMDLVNSPFRETLTEKGVREQNIFDYVAVLTYHRLPSFLSDKDNQEWIKNIEYVICDECHFFTSDSIFNSDCDWHLNLITSKLCHAIRIYMTATPWDVIHRICEAEQENFLDFRRSFIVSQNCLYIDRRYMVYYSFERDYSHCNLNFFEDFSEITPLINAENDEKWLIFIDNKEKAIQFKNKLNVSVTYLDAESKDLEEWRNLIQTERFATKVLLATSVIDCGINIIDKALKNIVIVSDNRVATMQMAGRKRCQDGEKVNIWVQNISKQKLSNRKQKLQRYIDLENKYDDLISNADKQNFVNKIWRSEDDIERTLFTVMLHKLIKNRSAFVYIRRMLRFYDDISKGKISFINEVRGWFGKPPQNNCVEIDRFYTEHKGEVLSEDSVNELRKLINRVYKESGRVDPQPTRKDELKHGALNHRLEEMGLPYEIQNKKKEWRFVFLGTYENKEKEK